MSNYGFRISSRSGDALTQLDKSVVYSSKFSTLKFFKRGYKSITTNGSGYGTGTVFHHLGYAPTYYLWRRGTASFPFLDAASYSNTFHPIPGTPSPWIPYHVNTVHFTDRSRMAIGIQGASNTTYDFLYYIFVDQGEVNQKTGLYTNNDYGMKAVKEGKDFESATEQAVAISSEYQTLKYFPEMITHNSQLSLPQLSSDFFDQTPQEGTYVDFMHGLGYPPFFLAYYESSLYSGNVYCIPETVARYSEVQTADDAITGWCDKERIRITFYRQIPGLTLIGDQPLTAQAETLTVKLQIFTENLALQ